MGFAILGSAEPKYLAATDILIGDMSNINYEFLLFNRPVILLANDWIKKYFPDFGIKASIDDMEEAILRSIKNPNEFEKERKFWLDIAISNPENGASKKYIDIALEKSKFKNPRFVLLDGNNAVRKTNLDPLFNELKRRKLDVIMTAKLKDIKKRYEETIFIGAHFDDLKKINYGYRIHIDHDLKAPSTANLAQAVKDYKNNKYFDNIQLHITTGTGGKQRTQFVLGKNKDRVVVGGYAKADDLISSNHPGIKAEICKELGFDVNKPLVTYAPAGPKKYMKPGGSYSETVLRKLKAMSESHPDFNLLVKIKYKKGAPISELINKQMKKAYSTYRTIRYSDGGKEWEIIINNILNKKQ
jgi:CDP-glycerol glycerophosphotransferase (TagB/SpsB family)